MRASDLLRCEVVDASGRRLGEVTDIRAVQDGPLRRGVQQAMRVEAFVVGPGGMADRLGFIRGRVDGPWLLRALLVRLERRAHVVRLEDFERWQEGDTTLRLRPGVSTHHVGAEPTSDS